MSLPGGYKRCALQQVWNIQDWSDLWSHVQWPIEMHLRTGGAKRCTFERPTEQATEPRAKVDYFFVIPVDSSVDSMVKRSENVAIALIA